jgi:heat-inducible transcriptional repressor
VEEELTQRQQLVLAVVVREYINTARPVGSQAVVAEYGLRVSPATVRNEMAYLEDAGYMTHLHTSAGRVPTEKGYRYFVERLMEEATLPPAEKRMIRHQFHQVQTDISEWMKLGASVLARHASAAAVVSKPKARRARLKQLELISIQSTTVLMVLVLQQGIVLQRMLNLDELVGADELRQMANRLTDTMSGLDAPAIAAKRGQLAPLAAMFLDLAVEMMERMDGAGETELYRDGLLAILKQPEYVEADHIRQLLGILESGPLLEHILAEAAPASGVQVIIGGEGRWDELADYSLVLARYGGDEDATGSLGVLGPLRMPYGRAVSTVRYVADVLTELLNQMYGSSGEGNVGEQR